MQLQDIPSLGTPRSGLLLMAGIVLLIVSATIVVGFGYCAGAGHFPFNEYFSADVAAALKNNALGFVLVLQLVCVILATEVYVRAEKQSHKLDRVFLIKAHMIDTDTIIDILRECEAKKSSKKRLGRRFSLLREVLYYRQMEHSGNKLPVNNTYTSENCSKNEPDIAIAESEAEGSELELALNKHV